MVTDHPDVVLFSFCGNYMMQAWVKLFPRVVATLDEMVENSVPISRSLLSLKKSPEERSHKRGGLASPMQ